MSALTPELLRLAAALAVGDLDTVRTLRRDAGTLTADVARAWREVLLQATLFAGFPRVVGAFDALAEHGGLGSPAPDEVDPEPVDADADAGRALFDAIYGERADAVRATLTDYHPLLTRWIAEHAYARVLARAGLRPLQRELVAVAMLAASGLERQLASHARGAVRLGASAATVAAAVDCALPYVGEAAWQRLSTIAEAYANGA